MSKYTCNITVEGDTEQLRDFKSKIKYDYEDDFEFHILLETPHDYFSNRDDNKIFIKYGHRNYRDWRIANWGSTGYNSASYYVVVNEPSLFIFEIETFYYAPLIWFTTVSKLYDKLNFEILFSCDENDDGGGVNIKNGIQEKIPGRLVNVAGRDEHEVYFDMISCKWKYSSDNSLCINDYIIFKFKKDEC